MDREERRGAAAAPIPNACGEREARAAAEALLHESEERFSRLAAASFEGIAITDRGKFQDANEQLATMLGCSLQELLGCEVVEFVAEEHRALVMSHIASGSEEPYRHLARRYDGSTFPVEIRAKTIHYRGRTARVTALRDITERLRGEDALRASEKKFRDIVDFSPIGIFQARTDGTLITVNRAFARMLGYASVSEVLGLGMARDVFCEPSERARLLAQGDPIDEGKGVEARFKRRDASPFWVQLNAHAVRDAAGRTLYFEGFIHDIDARKNAEAERERLQQSLRHSETMSAMGSLVAGVAHEVRNPLFSISATLDALESELVAKPGYADYAEYADLLRAQVARLSALMRDLLDYGRPPLLHLKAARPQDLVRRAVRACAPLARERAVVVLEDVPESLPALDGDAGRLEQVFENLVANAIQHSPRGATVRVGVQADNDLRFVVEDEGPGLAEADIPCVFQPFFTRRKGGTGLGLSVVQRIVEAHDGRVSAANRPTGGAMFTVALPRT